VHNIRKKEPIDIFSSSPSGGLSVDGRYNPPVKPAG